MAMHVFLIGYRGAGKSAVGHLLAQQLGMDCVDSDDLIEQQAGASIAEIFAREGESGFREREANVLAELVAGPPRVVALGGGAILRDQNRALLHASGAPVVWLTAAAEALHQRISGDPATAARRPQLTSHQGIDEVRSLLAAREPLYREAATLIVDTEDRSLEEIAAELCERLPAAG